MTEKKPLLSVIVAWNRLEEGRNLFHSIESSNPVKGGIEVIAIGNGKRPNWLMDWVHYFPLDPVGPSARRNLGASYAQGEILVFVDDDACLPRNFLRRISCAVDPKKKMMAGGPNLGIRHESFSEGLSDIIFRHPLGSGFRQKFRLGQGITHNSADLSFCNVGMPAWLYRELGGLDINLPYCEDHDFFKKGEEFGVEFTCDPKLYVWHRRRCFPRGHLKQVYNWGQYNAVVAKRYKKGLLKRLDNILPLALFVFIYLGFKLGWKRLFRLFVPIYMAIIILSEGLWDMPFRPVKSVVFALLFPFHLFAYTLGQFKGYFSQKS